MDVEKKGRKKHQFTQTGHNLFLKLSVSFRDETIAN